MPPDFVQLLRELTPRVLGVLIRRYRDFAAAEDAVQEASIAAAMQWPVQGIPESPLAWLIRVASRKMTDSIRTDAARRRRESESAVERGYAAFESEEADADDTLILVYMCCHPSLTVSSAIALTLRAVGGLSTSEIARAFLVPEATMAQRISRAKETIRASNVPFRIPNSAEQAERLRAVLHVVYLIFNEGYAASAGDILQRTDLAGEAIRLARMLQALSPEDAEVAGLLALLLLTDARREARTGPDAEPIPLDRQDRALWNREQIAEGVELLSTALPRGSVGPYQLQAAVAALHDEAASSEATDWPQILALYNMLNSMSDNPMVALNRAVAVAMVHGPRAGLELLGTLSGDARMREHHRLHAVRGHLQEMAGDVPGAIVSYQRAAALTGSLPERNYLFRRAAKLREGVA